MFFFLSKLFDVLLSPFTWGLALAAYAMPWRKRRRWDRKRLAGALGLAVLAFFALPPVSNAMMYRLEHATEPTYDPNVPYDAVILLGGVSDERVVAETKQPAYNENVDRLVATRRLLSENHARYAIISGAAMDPSLVEYGEARVLANQLVEWGIDASRVLLEERARNTHENAVYSHAMAKEHEFHRVLVVTSAFHMRRASECFGALPSEGVTYDTMSVDYRAYASSPGMPSLLPRANELAESTMIIREFLGLYIYRLQGYAKKR